MLKYCEDLLGMTLVDKKPGKGTQLTALGITLIDTATKNKHLLTDHLMAADVYSNTSIAKILSQSQAVRIIASDSEKLNKLRQHHLPIKLSIKGSYQALAAYAEGKCELAGFHIAAGNTNSEQLHQYKPYLDKKNDQFILLEKRQQGLISHREQPVQSLQQIIDQQ